MWGGPQHSTQYDTQIIIKTTHLDFCIFCILYRVMNLLLYFLLIISCGGSPHSVVTTGEYTKVQMWSFVLFACHNVWCGVVHKCHKLWGVHVDTHCVLCCGVQYIQNQRMTLKLCKPECHQPHHIYEAEVVIDI